jgi:DNA-binding transcriptional LysR family regulator
MTDFKFAEHLAVFIDVVRSGSFSGAARKRSTTPSSILRQIDGLEYSLLTRSTRALALTEPDSACSSVESASSTN